MISVDTLKQIILDNRNEMLFLNFEDERLEKFESEDFNKILECHAELSDKKPILFLDEMQNIEGWENSPKGLPTANTAYI